MSSKIILKKSSVAEKVPLLGDLEFGEVALNYTDGKVYYKHSTNEIRQLNLVGFTGSQGKSFVIARTYSTQADLLADDPPTGVEAGEYAVVDTGNTEDPENGELWYWDGATWTFIVDLSGLQGEPGVQGVQGFTGSQGDIGYTGSQGIIGYTGSQGIQGFTGSQGDIGYTGSQGITGFVGSQGIQGFTGSQGDIGYTGSQGITGFVGSQGIQGFTGSQGDDGIEAGITPPLDTDVLWLDESDPNGVGIIIPEPGGTTGQVQYNNAGEFAGAQNVLIENNNLRLSVTEPSVLPAADGLNLFARRIGGRVLPAFIGPSGLDSILQPWIARNKISWFNPPGNATTVQVLGMNLTATGTATAANIAVTNIHTAIRRLEYAVTTASTTAVAGVRSAVLQYHIGDTNTPYGGFTFVARFGPSRGVASNATRRFFAGLTSNSGAPTDADPSTQNANCIGVGTDAADTNWQIMHRSGTATTTKIDTGFPKDVPDTSEMYELVLFTAPTGTTDVSYRFTRLSDGEFFSGSITTNLPSATQLLTHKIYTSVGGTNSVVGISVASIYIETDF